MRRDPLSEYPLNRSGLAVASLCCPAFRQSTITVSIAIILSFASHKSKRSMNKRHRYQYGSLRRRKRIQSKDVWQFRYYETSPEGRRWRRSKLIRILEPFRLRLNPLHRYAQDEVAAQLT